MILALLLTGCAEYATYTPNAVDLTTIAQLPEGPTKSAVQATAVARYVAAEDARGTAQASGATIDAASATVQASTAQRLTAQANERHQRTQMTAEAQAIANQATAEAQAIEDARASAAAATLQALNVQATTQALNLAATQQALDWNATAMAEARNSFETTEAHDATATTASHNATLTAEARNIAATAQKQSDDAQATVVQATAASVARIEERERITEPLRAFAPWLVGAIGAVLLVIVGIYAWRLFEDRARLVRRKPDEGEPIMIISRERVSLPLRLAQGYADMTQGRENAPLLAHSAEAQDAATMRQQTANAIQARQVGEVAQAKSKHPARVVVQRQPTAAQRRRRQRQRTESGLIGVTPVAALADAAESGMLPPQLAQAIEAQWTEVKEM